MCDEALTSPLESSTKCFLLMDCPTDKTTVVDLIADANYGSIARTGKVKVLLNTVTACIENVYQEDRS